MLAHQLDKSISEILAGFHSESLFLKTLEGINVFFPKVDKSLAGVADGGPKSTEAMNQLRSHLGDLSVYVSNIDLRKFYFSLETFQSHLRASCGEGVVGKEVIDGVVAAIDAFSLKFGDYQSSKRQPVAAPLVTEAHKLWSQLNGFRSALMFVSGSLEHRDQGVGVKAEMSLLLPSQLTPRQFALKIIAIDELYFEICQLLNISNADEPLQISKIESGSLWAKVFGNPRAINIIIDILEASASFAYRNFTKEGKFSGVPRRVDAVDDVLGLSERLKAAGIDTHELDEHIRKSAVSIAKNINIILDGEAELTVNNRKHSVGDELQKMLLENKAPLRIERSVDEGGFNNEGGKHVG